METKKYKIGIEVQRLFREKKHGMEVVAMELINELQKIDHHNEYTIYVRQDKDSSCLNAQSNFIIKELAAKSYFTWEQVTLPSEIKKDNLDVFHSTCNTSTIFSKTPRILTLHDIIYLENLDFKGSAYQNFGNIYRRLIVPHVVKHSKVIITVSNYEKDKILRKFGLPNNKVKVIYNAVSTKFHTNYSIEALEYFKKDYNLPDQFILFLGNTAPKKNTSNVIRGYIEYISRTINGIPLVILDYQKSYIEDFLSKQGDNKLIHNFIFPGYISPDNMPLLYNLSTVFLYPSLRESFGLPILEAMACGTPVITSHTSAMPEVAGDAALLVDPFDYQQITSGIVNILGSEPLQLKMKERGLKRAKEFTWRSSAEQLVSLYRSVLE